MKRKDERHLTLSVNLDRAFLHLATSFVENAAMGFGLERSRALSLTLATEEIYSYLCRVSSPDHWVEIVCTGSVYYVQAEFRFSLEDFNMRAFNLTSTVATDDEESLDEMGLLIASRAVERFEVREESGGGLTLSLIKEKAYPAVTETPNLITKTLPAYEVREPVPEEVKLFCLLVNQHYGKQVIPTFLSYPGKVVDMVKAGALCVLLAAGADGHLGGGIAWHWPSARLVECFGPFLFGGQQVPAMAPDLIEACLAAIGRTPAVGLINWVPTAELPQEHFEALGRLDLSMPDGARGCQTASFRQMQEDPGDSVWAHAALRDFLAAEYERLVLPREILVVSEGGESKVSFSVLSAQFDRSQSRVTLRPIRPGLDAYENIAGHLRLLRGEIIRNIFFEMDLARPWQADFTPALLGNGFVPRLILPYAGEGDLVLFQAKDAL